MAFGIIIFKSFGHLYPLTMADDGFYDGMKEVMFKEYSPMEFIYGKKGISNEEIDGLNEQVCGLVKRINDGEPLNIKGELDSILGA